jgi:hypothetical protein
MFQRRGPGLSEVFQPPAREPRAGASEKMDGAFEFWIGRCGESEGRAEVGPHSALSKRFPEPAAQRLERTDERLRVQAFGRALDDEYGLARKLDADAALLRLPDAPARFG